MQLRFILAIGCLLLTVFYACERVVDSFTVTGYEYFPMEGDKYRVYQIDSTVYDEYNCTVQTVSYQVKEVTGATGTDGEGDTYHAIQRYFRNNVTEPWVLEAVWTEKMESNQIQRVEDNQRFIKLVFPIKQNRRWDGIPFIRRDTLVAIRGGSIDLYKDWDDFEVMEMGVPFLDTLSNETYPDVVKIMQVDKTNEIERRFATEIYAKNIGLVYKEMRILDTQCRPTGTCTGFGDLTQCRGVAWHLKAEKGFIYKQYLIEHNY